jgi:hypothetical protein
MITLENDSLRFSFPEVKEAVRTLVEQHINSILPVIVTCDRTGTVHALRSSWRFREATPEKRREAENQLINATRDEIEIALRRKSMRVFDGGRASSPALYVEFQRTLRIPDDGKVYPLPAGFGRFALRHVDDHNDAVPAPWIERGGVLMPMYQSEALWIRFGTDYPFAVKVGAGKINAVTGEAWTAGLQAHPQNYLVVPEQPWLDGFAVQKGIIRQFVAVPLGARYTVEEQITGKADVGGIQLQVFPMNSAAYFRTKLAKRLPRSLEDLVDELLDGDWLESRILFSQCMPSLVMEDRGMGLGMGGTMRQEIFQDPHDFSGWDLSMTSRCFVHLCNSLMWREITGGNPPHPPFTRKEYVRSGVPWFDYYREDLPALPGSSVLAHIKSVFTLGDSKGEKPLPDNTSMHPELVVQYGNTRRADQVREFVEQ